MSEEMPNYGNVDFSNAPYWQAREGVARARRELETAKRYFERVKRRAKSNQEKAGDSLEVKALAKLMKEDPHAAARFLRVQAEPRAPQEGVPQLDPDIVRRILLGQRPGVVDLSGAKQEVKTTGSYPGQDNSPEVSGEDDPRMYNPPNSDDPTTDIHISRDIKKPSIEEEIKNVRYAPLTPEIMETVKRVSEKDTSGFEKLSPEAALPEEKVV